MVYNRQARGQEDTSEPKSVQFTQWTQQIKSEPKSVQYIMALWAGASHEAGRDWKQTMKPREALKGKEFKRINLYPISLIWVHYQHNTISMSVRYKYKGILRHVLNHEPQHNHYPHI